MLQAIASQISSSLENAQLFSALKQSEATLRQHADDLEARNRELDAYSHEFLIRAALGEPRALEVYTQWNNTGIALTFRNVYERMYPDQQSGTGPGDAPQP